MSASDEELPADIEPGDVLDHEFLNSLLPSERLVIEYHLRAAWSEFVSGKLHALSAKSVATGDKLYVEAVAQVVMPASAIAVEIGPTRPEPAE